MTSNPSNISENTSQSTSDKYELKGLVAKATIEISAPREKVWEALTNPEIIKQYMFGSDVESSWKEGDSIVWKGEWQGKPFEDRGTIMAIEKPELLVYSHYSPMMGKPDLPENYHTIKVELFELGDTNTETETREEKTVIVWEQDNNEDEEKCAHSEGNWMLMLQQMKKLIESAE